MGLAVRVSRTMKASISDLAKTVYDPLPPEAGAIGWTKPLATMSCQTVDFRGELTRDFRREVTCLHVWFGSQALVKVGALSFFGSGSRLSCS